MIHVPAAEIVQPPICLVSANFITLPLAGGSDGDVRGGSKEDGRMTFENDCFG